MQEYKPEDFEKVTLGRKLGSGSFGTVYVGLLHDGRYVAVKQLEIDEKSSPNQSPSSTGEKNDQNLEVEVHRRLQHTNIIRYLHSVPKDGKLNVYLEIVTGGSLTSIMKSLPDQKLPPSVVRIYTKHMFCGLEYLHKNGVAHRDIKGENILVSQDTGVAKLADFDQAKVVQGTLRSSAGGNNANTLAGTPYWIAPEVLTQEEGYNPFKADIWSAGCTCAEMFTGKAPWAPMQTPMAIMYRLANSTGWPDAIPQEEAILGKDMKDFLDKCFIRDPSKRPSADELLQHPYLQM